MAAVKRLAILALALVVVLMAGFCGLARAQNVKPVSEADLTKLIELQAGDDAVIARVERSGVAFSVDAAALERLRNTGASEPVLAAVQKAGQPANAITYEGILKLVQQGTNEDQILKRLQESPTTFTLDANQTAELERAGASPRLLQALQQLRNPVSRGSDISDFVVILDCSGSMRELTPEGSTKMEAAKQVVTRFIRDIPEGKRLALIVYGIQPINNKLISCKDVQVKQHLSRLDVAAKERLAQYISDLQPFGATPLALALETAGQELSGSQGLGQLVVVTDGMETCDGNPGQVAEELMRKLSLPHGVDVVGFGVAPAEKTALQAIVAKGKGHFYDAGTAEELDKALIRAEQEAQARAREQAAAREQAEREAEAKRLALLKEQERRKAEEEKRARGEVEEQADLPPRVKALIEALQDKDGWVRVSAARNLGELGAKAKSVIPALVKALAEALQDEDSLVRGTAAMSLEKMGAKAKGAVPALVKRVADERFGRWRRDQTFYTNTDKDYIYDKDTALAALKALAPEKVEQALVDATKAKNPEVKRWASDRLSELDEGK